METSKSLPEMSIERKVITAIASESYGEVQRLIRQVSPGDERIARPIIHRMQTPLSFRRDAFCSLLVTAMLHGMPLSELLCQSSASIDPENILLALVILLFQGRPSGVPIPQSWSRYYQQHGFSPANVAAKIYLNEFLSSKRKAHHLGSTQPTSELINFADRSGLSELTSEMLNNCTALRDGSVDLEFIEKHLREKFLDEATSLEPVKHLAQLAREQMVAKTVSTVCEAAVREWDEAADFVVRLIGKEQDRETLIDLVLKQFENPVTPPRALFLIEAYLWLGDSSGYLQRITALTKTLKEKKWTKAGEVKDYSVCIRFPKMRNDNMRNMKNETAKVLYNLNKTLCYIRYLACASVVDSLDRLNRIGFLVQCVPGTTYDMQPMVVKLEKRMQCQERIEGLMPEIRRMLKGLAFMTVDITEFEFDSERYVPWPFNPATNLASVGPETLNELRVLYQQSLDVAPLACSAMRYHRPCLRCGDGDAFVVCGQCKSLVLCDQCRDAGCPNCGGDKQ